MDLPVPSWQGQSSGGRADYQTLTEWDQFFKKKKEAYLFHATCFAISPEFPYAESQKTGEVFFFGKLNPFTLSHLGPHY